MGLDFDNYIEEDKIRSWRSRRDVFIKADMSSNTATKLVTEVESIINTIDMNVDSTSSLASDMYSKLKEDVAYFKRYDKSDLTANRWYQFFSRLDQTIPLLLVVSSYKSWMVTFFQVIHNKMVDLLTKLIEEQNELKKTQFKAEAWEKMYQASLQNKQNMSTDEFQKVMDMLKDQLENQNNTINSLSDELIKLKESADIIATAKNRADKQLASGEKLEKPNTGFLDEFKKMQPPPKHNQEKTILPTPQEKEQVAPIIEEVDSETEDDDNNDSSSADESFNTDDTFNTDKKIFEELTKENDFKPANTQSGERLIIHLDTPEEIEEIVGVDRKDYQQRNKQMSFLFHLAENFSNYSFSYHALFGFLGIADKRLRSLITESGISPKKLKIEE